MLDRVHSVPDLSLVARDWRRVENLLMVRRGGWTVPLRKGRQTVQQTRVGIGGGGDCGDAVFFNRDELLEPHKEQKGPTERSPLSAHPCSSTMTGRRTTATQTKRSSG